MPGSDDEISSMSWEDTYRAECRVLTEELPKLYLILRYDPQRLGVDRIDTVCKRLISLSFHVERVLEAAQALLEECPDSDCIHQAQPGWFLGGIEDPEIEIQCSILEYKLRKKAEQLEDDCSLDLIIATDLEELMEEFERNFGV
jgi:hypothetical protein